MDSDTQYLYQYCMECDTEYETAEDLVRLYTSYGWGKKEVKDADTIGFCPKCLHDFV